MAKTVVILPNDGFQAADVNSWTRMPQQTNAGLSIVKEPTTGTFTEMTKYFPGIGYLALEDDQDTPAKYRVLITDHPDGG